MKKTSGAKYKKRKHIYTRGAFGRRNTKGAFGKRGKLPRKLIRKGALTWRENNDQATR